MLLKLDKARVTSPEVRWDKARAELTINEGDEPTATVRVLNRRTGELLAEHGGAYQVLDTSEWRVGGWEVARATGCGCGGTTATAL